MGLENFIKNYNNFVKAANDDCGEEVFSMLKEDFSSEGNIFSLIYKNNEKKYDSAISFFVPHFIRKGNGNIIGYDPSQDLYFFQNSMEEIFTIEERGDEKKYECAPNTTIFIDLLVINLDAERKMIHDDSNITIRAKAFEKAYELVNRNEKYKFFCKTIAGV